MTDQSRTTPSAPQIYGRNPVSILSATSSFEKCTADLEAGRVTFWRHAPEHPSETVILLHGLGGSSTSLLPLATLLRGQREIVVADLPAHGGSAAPAGLGWWETLSADRIAASLVDLVERLSPDRTVHLVGFSMGGLVAMHMALQAPDSLHRLSLVSCAFASLLQTMASPLALLRRPEVALGLVAQITAGALPLPSPLVSAVARQRRLFGRFAAHPEHLSQEVVEDALSAHGSLWTNLRTLPNSLGYDLRSTVTSLTVSDMELVVGSADALGPIADAETMVGWNPQVQLRVIEDAGHWLAAERPYDLADCLRLRSTDLQAPSDVEGGTHLAR